ncbi:A24 family peptidase C-terminal domain-containing protein [Halovivax sp.]|uniref:A24 family peptidase C-terminal domain-containing protein n=1 Tax=Halovivax sp. TaxID=1935978 RepID=UPI0025BC62DD|nr:A24 family peptidase C-terminal domain-containing protein [Halovivax sp.]
MTLSSASASVPDLLRLVAIPVFAWVAILDVRTRRVPTAVWIPLGALGAALLAWDARVAYRADVFAWEAFLIPAALSLGFVVPLAYLFWWFGGFGGADAKALLVLALLFPVVPTYAVGGWTLPVAPGGEAVPFSLTILANGVLVGLAIPAVLAVRNAAAGRIAPVMLVGWPVAVERVTTTHGKLLETPDGMTLGGLDLDALRMYLRWRGLTLAELRADPARYRDPDSLPDEPNPPTDGAVEAASVLPDGGETISEDPTGGDGDAAAIEAATGETDDEDPWGAAAFLDSIEGSAYGTSATDLRDGLAVLAEKETVWISPGTPFLVPLFAGLLIALVYGDLLVTLIV